MLVFDEVLDGYEIIEEGEWTQDSKMQYQEFIIKHLETGKFYSFEHSRSGSPFTEWDYDMREYPREYKLDEVEKKEVTTIKWVLVKQSK